MMPGDMPHFDPFLKAAFDTLADDTLGLAVRHTIVISDGDPQLGPAGKAALADMEKQGMTLTTVGVSTHGVFEDQKMEEIAATAALPGKGSRYWKVKDPEDLPAIYTREARRISQSFLYTERFQPKLVLRTGPAVNLDDPLPDLFGFVRTTLKPRGAEMLVEGPKTYDQRFPILATWQYGLGRAAAFTSDARTVKGGADGWDHDWYNSDTYQKHWEQVVGWALRGGESDKLVVSTEVRDGKVRVTVEAADESGSKPITDLELRGFVSTPKGAAAKTVELKFKVTAGGAAEAEFPAEEAGSYLLNVRSRQRVAGYKGRFKEAVPKTVKLEEGKLRLADGTEVRRVGDKLVYADDGKSVEETEYDLFDGRRAGVSVSYSPEFADLETNAPLLAELARITGGKVFGDTPAELARVVESGDVFRSAPETLRAVLPLWHWLAFAAALVLVFDVGVRRVAVDAPAVGRTLSAAWTRLRKRAEWTAASAEDAFLSQLNFRKRHAEEAIERERAGRRFQPGEAVAPPPAADDASAAPPPQPLGPAPAPQPSQPAAEEDFFAKMQRAKRRADHHRDKPEP